MFEVVYHHVCNDFHHVCNGLHHIGDGYHYTDSGSYHIKSSNQVVIIILEMVYYETCDSNSDGYHHESSSFQRSCSGYQHASNGISSYQRIRWFIFTFAVIIIISVTVIIIAAAVLITFAMGVFI